MCYARDLNIISLVKPLQSKYRNIIILNLKAVLQEKKKRDKGSRCRLGIRQQERRRQKDYTNQKNSAQQYSRQKGEGGLRQKTKYTQIYETVQHSRQKGEGVLRQKREYTKANEIVQNSRHQTVGEDNQKISNQHQPQPSKEPQPA